MLHCVAPFRMIFQDIVPVLRRFGKTNLQARKNLRSFLAEGLEKSTPNMVVDIIRKSNTGESDIHQTGCWVIGDQEFVKSVLDADKEHRLRIAEYCKNGVTLEVAARKVADHYNITVTQLLTRSRLTVTAEARKVFAYGCRSFLGFPVNAIGKYLGVTGPSASTCIKNGEVLATSLKIDNLFLNLCP
jgi:chromosomal replication initiation ATPase DnaA